MFGTVDLTRVSFYNRDLNDIGSSTEKNEIT